MIKSAFLSDESELLHDGGDDDWRRHGSISVAGPGRGAPVSRQTVRRKSRVQKQHSYDEEIKNSTTGPSGAPSHCPQSDIGLGGCLFSYFVLLNCFFFYEITYGNLELI